VVEILQWVFEKILETLGLFLRTLWRVLVFFLNRALDTAAIALFVCECCLLVRWHITARLSVAAVSLARSIFRTLMPQETSPSWWWE